ncbi:putative carbonic anhydrase 3 [Dysidea avara]|uniref:putative carbonic anhydrase 3 n=1 Tax=Dysidea avara TaxID=196820 RepID=UPI00331A7DB2
MKLLEVSLCILLSLVTANAIGVAWNYSDQDAWKTVDGWDCDGRRQSPINIVTSALVRRSSLIDLVLTNFDQTYDGNWTNTGHALQFNPDTSSLVPTFQNHLGTYQLVQFHFHWGRTSAVGSEHQVDGSTYGGELHFVTRKTTGSATAGDAFAVLGVLLRGDSSLSLSGVWSSLASDIPSDEGDYVSLSGIRPMDMIPANLSYYYYQGSLTTPACSEVVQWFLLRNAVSVPEQFLQAMRTSVLDADGAVLQQNYRDTQPLNGRKVMIQGTGGSPVRQNSLSIILLVLLSVFILGLCH